MSSRGGRGNWRGGRGSWRGGWSGTRSVSKPVTIDSSPGANSDCDSDSTTPIIGIEIAEKCPGWKLYFTNEEYDASSMTARRVDIFKKHFQHYSHWYEFSKIEEEYWFPLPIRYIQEDVNIMNMWPSFNEDLIKEPENVLGSIGLAMFQTLMERSKFANNQKRVYVRLEGLAPLSKFDLIMKNCNGQLVTLTGTLMKAEPAAIKCKWMAFTCALCNAQLAVKQRVAPTLITPSCCRKGCKARSGFIPQLSSPFSRVHQQQVIHLQENLKVNRNDATVRPIQIELSQELVDRHDPGKIITVTGIMRIRKVENKPSNATVDHKVYIKAVSVRINEKILTIRRNMFTQKDMEAINAIRSEESTFRSLVQSMCPAIVGHEFAKAGLLLGLFGGSKLLMKRRSEIHVLLVGDPGIGKSKMLQKCAEISPRGIFVCGNSSSSIGLAASVGQNGAIEAGALALSDEGTCCIDEFDKMSNSHHCLLEVMEQQEILITKSGVKGTLNARTSILAAANPGGGYYDKSKTIMENLKIPIPLLSRFDLIYVLLDRPNLEMDRLIVAHKRQMANEQPDLGSSFFSDTTSVSVPLEYSKGQLHDFLKLKHNENIDLIPAVLIQNYIGYARENCHPKLSEGAHQTLKNFYEEMLRSRNEVNSTPITTRQLEAIIRLTLARARVDLAEEATVEHANQVLEIVKYSMIDVFSEAGDNFVQLNRSITGAASTQSKSTQVKKFLQILLRHCRRNARFSFVREEIKELAENNGYLDWFGIMETLNHQGFILKLGTDNYKVIDQ